MRKRRSYLKWQHRHKIQCPLCRGSPAQGDLAEGGTLPEHQPEPSRVEPARHFQVWREVDAGMTSQMLHSLGCCQDLEAKHPQIWDKSWNWSNEEGIGCLKGEPVCLCFRESRFGLKNCIWEAHSLLWQWTSGLRSWFQSWKRWDWICSRSRCLLCCAWLTGSLRGEMIHTPRFI